MQFSTRPALAALLMSTGVLAKACKKGYHVQHHHTTLSTSILAAASFTLPVFETSSIAVEPTSTISSISIASTPSTTSSASIAETTLPSSVATTAPSSSVVATTSSSSAAATTTAASSSSSLTSDQQQALELQNGARSDVSETALIWDDALASDALAWAQNLASSSSVGTLTHSSGTGQGENLYWQSNSDAPYANAATAWVDEKSDYNGEAITGTGNFEEYGHYTQIIWESTTKVGMGIASDGAGGYYVVARYSPEGNVIGDTPTSA